jgi:hypothetical protein
MLWLKNTFLLSEIQSSDPLSNIVCFSFEQNILTNTIFRLFLSNKVFRLFISNKLIGPDWFFNVSTFADEGDEKGGKYYEHGLAQRLDEDSWFTLGRVSFRSLVNERKTRFEEQKHSVMLHRTVQLWGNMSFFLLKRFLLGGLHCETSWTPRAAKEYVNWS